jgi:hypothetical protein
MSADADPIPARAATRRPPRGARHRVERMRERGAYDRAAVHAVLDAGFIAHVSFAHGAQPFVIPMLYARDGERLLLHGSVASRLINALAAGSSAASRSRTSMGWCWRARTSTIR